MLSGVEAWHFSNFLDKVTSALRLEIIWNNCFVFACLFWGKSCFGFLAEIILISTALSLAKLFVCIVSTIIEQKPLWVKGLLVTTRKSSIMFLWKTDCILNFSRTCNPNNRFQYSMFLGIISKFCEF